MHRTRLSPIRELGKYMQSIGVADAFVLPTTGLRTGFVTVLIEQPTVRVIERMLIPRPATAGSSYASLYSACSLRDRVSHNEKSLSELCPRAADAGHGDVAGDRSDRLD